MSKYGRLWEQVKEIREDLKKLMPGTKLDSYESAGVEFENHVKETEVRFQRIRNRLSAWKNLETKMQKTE